ncbi:MAG: DUF177 domain-containing protein [Peptococcaceae bacterium]|nr:DUF177 domain-containing protein [Peptococcaceae bacterium]
MLLINLAGIRKSFGASAEFTLREHLATWEVAGETVEFTQPVEVEVRATNLANSLLLQGQIQTEVKLVCSRCLEPFNLAVTVNFAEELCHAADLTSYMADHPEAQEEENYQVFASDEFDIRPMVSEQIVLALPMKPLCREECEGLCPKCGCDWNKAKCACDLQQGDPRLAGLADFFNKE